MSNERVCGISDLPEAGEAVRMYAGGEMLAIVRDNEGGLHAIDDTCSHAMVSLSEGEVDGCTIECWLHGSRFDLRTGEPTGLPAISPIDVYPITVDGDDVFVDTSITIGEQNAQRLAKEN